MRTPPRTLQTLTDRFDGELLQPRARRARVRLALRDGDAWDAVLEERAATLVPAKGEADATLTADARTWARIAADIRGGMDAYRSGRLAVRHNLHLGVGFLAATSDQRGRGRVRFSAVRTRRGRLSTLEAGSGPALVAIHGLGATKGSFLPTVAALGERMRVIAVDLPGFGDSDKPLGASYDARFFARAIVGLLDALELERAHLIGNSLGGRVALEVALAHPERVRRLALLCPSLAWRRQRPWAPVVRLMQPKLGLVQVAPRPFVEALVHRMIPGAEHGWTAAGVDEFLRAYLTPSGRAAFYAAARHIYLEEPHGDEGFWTRLRDLRADALFVWGKRDRLVPIAFARHVAEALPHARQLELDCGHVPQVERPRQTHDAVADFLLERAARREKVAASRQGQAA
ncbi:MAG TPA: alpha/beta fold hydrolase [Solirubrobacteraceae bacterium]|nr:alpha/beta fold hydrolase [Solirubrobacteraceae bacterium]